MNIPTSALILPLVLSCGIQAQTPPTVPTEYQPLYNELDQALTAFETKIDGLWTGQKTGTLFGSESLYGNSNNGPLLWDPHNYEECLIEIARQRAMGLQTVMLSVHFPYLYRPFFTDQREFLNYANFYSKIASFARSLGMKIAVETQTIFPDNDPTGAVQAFYSTLTWEQYKGARSITAQNVAMIMQPDYLTLISEPDTEADLTGQMELNTVSGVTEMIALMAHDVKALNIPNLRIGAGAGSWHQSFDLLLRGLLGIPGVDYFSLHVYPASGTTPGDFLDKCLYAVSVASQYRKTTAIGETWPYKESITEYGHGLTPFNIFRRDPFSFWSPIDIKAIRTLMKMAFWGKMLYMATYFTRYHFSYVEYSDQTKDLTYTQMMDLSTQLSEAAMNAGTWSATGTSYAGYISGTLPLQ